MANVRQIWYRDGAAALMQLATEGTKKPRNCKFTVKVDSLLVLGAIEIIPCTEQAIESIESVEAWKI